MWATFKYPLSLCLLLTVGSSIALSPHRGLAPIPIQIQSDTASFDQRSGIAIHRGSVLLSQGDRRLSADELRVKRDARGHIQIITALGHPARYQGAFEKGHPTVVGKADKMTYQPEKMILILENHAELTQPPNVFRGPHIQYDLAKKVITSPASSKGRTVLILQPR